MADESMTPDVAGLYAVIGERIARARDRRGLSQEALAAQIGVSRASITQAESGHQKLPLQSLYLIAAVLGVAIGDLLPTFDELSLSSRQADIVARVNSDPSLSSDGRDALRAFFNTMRTADETKAR
jgi:transcriptional regulator with XRE-family HTH domain